MPNRKKPELVNSFTLSIKIKVVLYIVTAVFAFIVILNTLFYKMYSDDVRQVLIKELADKAEQTSYHCELILKNIENISDTIVSSTLVQQYETDIGGQVNESYLKYEQTRVYLKNMEYTIEGITSIDIYLKSEMLLLTSDYGIYSSLDSDTANQLEQLCSGSKKPVWNEQYNSFLPFFQSRKKNCITLVRPIISFASENIIGLLAINLDKQVLQSILKMDGASSCFLNSKGEMVINALNAKVEENLLGSLVKEYETTGKKGYFYSNVNNENNIFVYNAFPHASWTYILFSPVSASFHRLQKAKDYIMLCLIFSFTLIFILIFLLSKKMFNPVNKLIHFMNMVERGNFNVRIDENRQDEFGYIYRNFNSMVGKIRFLFQELFEEKLLKKDAELKLLQSKINPHFIYNIFDNMNWLLQMERYDVLGNLVEAVAEYYKKTLNLGKDFITVSDTLAQLRSYADIQSIRFKNRFTCEILFDEAILGKTIPNFLLQPLLENAICHGIEPKRSSSRISVTGKSCGGEIVFIVEDDGVGIDETKLEEIRSQLDSSELDGKDFSFALVNLNRRIKLYYGPPYALTIESRKGAGTKVEIRIPAETGILEEAGCTNC